MGMRAIRLCLTRAGNLPYTAPCAVPGIGLRKDRHTLSYDHLCPEVRRIQKAVSEVKEELSRELYLL